MVRHRCEFKQVQKQPNQVSQAERFWKDKHKPVFKCPVCSKNFTSEGDLDHHIREKKKQDEEHRSFFLSGSYFEEIGELLEGEESSELSGFYTKKFIELAQDVKFGRITLKKRKKKRAS
ncbi:MAG: hypothetical protein ACTSU5_05000 [Promethearchaeota archaeon]